MSNLRAQRAHPRKFPKPASPARAGATPWPALAIMAAVALGACHSAATRLYALDPMPPRAPIADYQAPALHVDAVSVPPGWDRVEILSPSASGALEIRDFDHWSAPLPQLLRQALSEDLERRLPPGSVVYPHLPKPAGALGISVDILEFTVADGRATMRAEWLITPSAGSPQGSKRESAALQAAAGPKDPASMARAWSELTGQLADRIAADAAAFDRPQ